MQGREVTAVFVDPKDRSVVGGATSDGRPVEDASDGEEAGLRNPSVHAVEFVKDVEAGAIRLNSKDRAVVVRTTGCGHSVQRPVRALDQQGVRVRGWVLEWIDDFVG